MSYRACTQSADKARSQKMERYFCKFDLMKDQQSMLICGQSNPQHHVYWHQIFHRQSSQTSQPRTKISRQLKHQTVENISTYDKKLAYFGIFIIEKLVFNRYFIRWHTIQFPLFMGCLVKILMNIKKIAFVYWR